MHNGTIPLQGEDNAGYQAEVTAEERQPRTGSSEEGRPPSGVNSSGVAVGMPTHRQGRGDDQGRLLDQGSSR